MTSHHPDEKACSENKKRVRSICPDGCTQITAQVFVMLLFKSKDLIILVIAGIPNYLKAFQYKSIQFGIRLQQLLYRFPAAETISIKRERAVLDGSEKLVFRNTTNKWHLMKHHP